ncbi:MAG: hypothetical protein JXA53_00720 [Bacteroidales bacterium]|nr:hypothetical protein [Bacteroidales bacterium]
METVLMSCDGNTAYTIVKDSLAECNKFNWDTNPMMQNVIDDLTNENNELFSSIGKVNINMYTTSKTIADQDRDNSIIGTKMLLRGYQHFGGEKAESATVLLNMVAAHGKEIQRSTYEKETAAINSIISKSKKPEFKVHIDKLPFVAEAFGILEAQNATFESITVKAIEQNLEMTSDSSLTIQKYKVLTVFNNSFFPLLHVLSITDNATYNELYEKISILINNVNVKIRANKTRKESEKPFDPATVQN